MRRTMGPSQAADVRSRLLPTQTIEAKNETDKCNYPERAVSSQRTMFKAANAHHRDGVEVEKERGELDQTKKESGSKPRTPPQPENAQGKRRNVHDRGSPKPGKDTAHDEPGEMRSSGGDCTPEVFRTQRTFGEEQHKHDECCAGDPGRRATVAAEGEATNSASDATESRQRVWLL